MINHSTDVLKLCRQENIPIWEVAIRYEVAQANNDRQKIIEKMTENFKQMKASIYAGLEANETGGSCKMLRKEAKKLMNFAQTKTPLSGLTISKAAGYAISVMEVNCSMGKIVASPTAGSCGVLPGALMSAIETLDLGYLDGVNALFTAGMIGIIIGRNASISGAQGGCQAEIGSAAAMGAAAVVEMAGGSPQMAFDAAAIALKNVMGLVCDPVAGLVEVPCAKRNGLGVANSLLSADMVLAGIPSIIPFDEVVWAMDKVGKALPSTLKETAEGGTAATPTAKRLRNRIYGKN